MYFKNYILDLSVAYLCLSLFFLADGIHFSCDSLVYDTLLPKEAIEVRKPKGRGMVLYVTRLGQLSMTITNQQLETLGYQESQGAKETRRWKGEGCALLRGVQVSTSSTTLEIMQMTRACLYWARGNLHSRANLVVHEDNIPKLMIDFILITGLLDNMLTL